MIRALFIGTAFVFSANAVFAGGVGPAPQPTPPVVAPAPVSDWTGFYAGAQLETILDGEASGVGLAEFDGTLYGLFAGYRYDFGTFVLGGEVDYVVGSGDFTSITPAAPTFDVDYNSLVRVGAEFGYDAGNVLPYATVGFASIELGLPANTSDGTGYFYGVGLDFRVSDQIVIGGELLQHEFDDYNDIDGETLDALTFGLNVAFTF